MSPSGPEVIRQIKSQIHEVDPAEVHNVLGNGAVIVDVRETHEYEAGHGFDCDHRADFESTASAHAMTRTLAWLDGPSLVD